MKGWGVNRKSLKEKGSVRDQRQHSKGIELITAGRGARKMSIASSNTSTGHTEGVKERENNGCSQIHVYQLWSQSSSL